MSWCNCQAYFKNTTGHEINQVVIPCLMTTTKLAVLQTLHGLADEAIFHEKMNRKVTLSTYYPHSGGKKQIR